MFKLLAQKQKDKVMREYSLRRNVVILFVLIFVCIVTIIGLLPSYMLSGVRYEELAGQASSVDEKRRAEAVEAADWLSRTNRALRLLTPSLDTDRPSEFIDNVIAERGEGILLTNFAWKKDGESTLLSVEGVAATRQDLIAFEDRIKSSGLFADVALPISDLARDREIDFTIRFTLLP